MRIQCIASLCLVPSDSGFCAWSLLGTCAIGEGTSDSPLLDSSHVNAKLVVPAFEACLTSRMAFILPNQLIFPSYSIQHLPSVLLYQPRPQHLASVSCGSITQRP